MSMSTRPGLLDEPANALEALRSWRDLEHLEIETAALRVLDEHLCQLEGEARDGLHGLQRVQALLARDALPIICLPGSAGAIDPFSLAPVYVADPLNAARNLLGNLDAGGWSRVRAAAARALGLR